ncbi:MAG: hypothetical protein ACPG8W_11620 [Candidatus Promineifilaceae bacterium]
MEHGTPNACYQVVKQLKVSAEPIETFLTELLNGTTNDTLLLKKRARSRSRGTYARAGPLSRLIA